MFGYSAAEITDLEQSLSPERFNSYVRRSGGDREMAIRLYERNTNLSEALYGVIQGVEVCLRNGIHRRLASAYRPDWYDAGPALLYPLPDKVAEAKRKIQGRRKPLTPGRIVAELSLGFWTALLGPKYEKSLWVPHLHQGFPYGVRIVTDAVGKPKNGKIARHQIAARLMDIRDLRNRIAHHEPIVDLNLNEKYREIIEAIGWMCPTTADWVATTNCFPARFARPLPGRVAAGS
jgi:hypothetical protein